MARTASGLPAGIRLSDHINLGVIAKVFPLDRVREVLAETGKASERERDLPAQVMVYYAIALALYMSASTREVRRCLLEGLRWLWGAEAVRVAGKSGISQARTRLGAQPLRRRHDRLVRPVATRTTRGAWYRRWRPSGAGVAAPVPAGADDRRRRSWSVWTAPAWTWSTARRTARRSGFPGRAAARAPSRSCASWRWSRTARTGCSARIRAATRTARRRWPGR